jgi:hypothetical protein
MPTGICFKQLVTLGLFPFRSYMDQLKNLATDYTT